MDEAKEFAAKALGTAIDTLVKDATSFVTNKLKDFYIDTINKEDVDSGSAFEEYLQKVYNAYSVSKSIIYINEARKLSSFFIPMNLELVKTTPYDPTYTVSGKNITDVLERNDKVIITGIGGMGKSMHLSNFCTDAIENAYKIPVFIQLRWFNNHSIGEKPFEELIYERLIDFGFKLEKNYFLYSLQGGKYVFLLDGFDEISKDRKSQIAIRIQTFTQRYSGNSFIISSRTTDDICGLNEYSVYSLCKMDMKQASQLIMKLEFSLSVKKKFLDKLVVDLYEKYKEFVSVPLLLSILFITYVGNTAIPDTLCEFYDLAFNTMLYRHDNLKAGFERHFSSGLSKAEFKRIFIQFCFRTYFNDSYSFSETSLLDNIHAVSHVITKPFDEHAYKNDLVDISCMLIRDGLEYAFIHRSFQEYYAAVYVSDIIEEEQKELCSEFIYSMHPEIDAIPNNFSESPLSAINNKTIDFLMMLHDINSKRFEHVVLKPILEKINIAYEKCDKNLFRLTKMFFYINDEEEEEGDYDMCRPPTHYYYINFKSTFTSDEFKMFNLEEYNVLCFFYQHLLSNKYSKSYIASEEEMCKILSICPKEAMYILRINNDCEKYTRIRTLISFNNSEYVYQSISAALLSFFDIMLTEYDKIKQRNQKLKGRMILSDRINKY